MPKPVIIVTGANGQLGREVNALSAGYPHFHFDFLAKEDLAIQDAEAVHRYFDINRPAYCINCAAYTAVDKAETEKDKAMQVNADAVGILAAACTLYETSFIHISTDYVFDGTASTPYAEEDTTIPVNFYGSTKLKGEQLALENNSRSIVIRTSWVYSSYGNNFVKTMMRLMKEKENLNVVSDQLGSPTYAADLAKVILQIVERSYSDSSNWVAGIYHFSNEGIISWYEFAVAIKELIKSNCTVHPIPTSGYPTPAKRPAYSAFNKNKITATYQLEIQDWYARLSAAVEQMT